jgi:hypothetical protein
MIPHRRVIDMIRVQIDVFESTIFESLQHREQQPSLIQFVDPVVEISPGPCACSG